MQTQRYKKLFIFTIFLAACSTPHPEKRFLVNPNGEVDGFGPHLPKALVPEINVGKRIDA